MINLDVNRTYQDNSMFHSNENKELLTNVLFIWAKENPEVGYKQGMNEIIGVLYLSIVDYYQKVEFKLTAEELLSKSKDINQISKEYDEFIKCLYLYIYDISYIQSDLYYFFNEIMKRGMKELYDNGPINPKNKDKVDNSIILTNLNIDKKVKDLFQIAWDFEVKPQLEISESVRIN